MTKTRASDPPYAEDASIDAKRATERVQASCHA
jgi:hypothetical protein